MRVQVAIQKSKYSIDSDPNTECKKTIQVQAKMQRKKKSIKLILATIQKTKQCTYTGHNTKDKIHYKCRPKYKRQNKKTTAGNNTKYTIQYRCRYQYRRQNTAQIQVTIEKTKYSTDAGHKTMQCVLMFMQSSPSIRGSSLHHSLSLLLRQTVQIWSTEETTQLLPVKILGCGDFQNHPRISLK